MGVGVSQGMSCADERLKPMQGLVGFAAQTQINADKVKGGSTADSRRFKNNFCASVATAYFSSRKKLRSVEMTVFCFYPRLSVFIRG
jgi:hypothetical protein